MTKPDVVTEPGEYVTRCGETVIVGRVSKRHDFGCHGAYTSGNRCSERWHKSGRIFATSETPNDIVARKGS